MSLKMSRMGLVPLLAFAFCARAPRQEEGTLRNGLRFVFLHKNIPITSAIFFVGCGDAHGAPNLTRMTAEMLLRGTRVRTPEQLYEEIERMGGMIGVETDLSFSALYLETPSPNFEDGFGIMAECMAAPSFDEEQMKQIQIVRKKTMIGSLGKPKGSWDDSGVRSMLFEGSPLAAPAPAGEQSFSRDQIEEHYKTWFKPSNITLAVVGKFDGIRIMETLEKHWDLKKKETVSVSPLLPVGRVSNQKEKAVTTTMPYDRVMLGFRAPAVFSEPFFPASILEFLLTSGRSGLLKTEVEKAGCPVLGISSSYREGPGYGYFLIVADAALGHAENVRDHILETLGILRQETTIEAREIALRKTWTIIASGLQYPMESAILLAMMKSLGTAYSTVGSLEQRMRSITPDDLQKAVREILADPVILIARGGGASAKKGK